MPELDQKLCIKDRVDILLDVVKPGEKALICTHDNPDPDSIASAFALGHLLEHKKGIEYTLTYGGVLGRAENRAMVRLLKIPLVPIHRVDVQEFDVVGLLDTQPEVGNHALTAERVAGKKMICIDHHPARPLSAAAAFADVGGDFGATSTLLTHYLHEAGVKPDRTLASALFYGIKSDTRDLGREASEDDVWAYSHLVKLTDMPLVSAVEHPRLPRSYFTVLQRAIQKAQVHENVVTCDLGEVYVPDLVPETADRLSTAQGIRWALVAGEYENEVYASLRVNDRRYSAGKLVREVMKKYPQGSAGGHGSMAGARLPHSVRTKSAMGRTRARRRLLRDLALATGIDPKSKTEPFAPVNERLAKPGEPPKTTKHPKVPPPAKSPKLLAADSPPSKPTRNGKPSKAVSTAGKTTGGNGNGRQAKPASPNTKAKPASPNAKAKPGVGPRAKTPSPGAKPDK